MIWLIGGLIAAGVLSLVAITFGLVGAASRDDRLIRKARKL